MRWGPEFFAAFSGIFPTFSTQHLHLEAVNKNHINLGLCCLFYPRYTAFCCKTFWLGWVFRFSPLLICDQYRYPLLKCQHFQNPICLPRKLWQASLLSTHHVKKLRKKKRANWRDEKFDECFLTVYKRLFYGRISFNFHLIHWATKRVWGEREDKNVKNVFFKGTCVQHFRIELFRYIESKLY